MSSPCRSTLLASPQAWAALCRIADDPVPSDRRLVARQSLWLAQHELLHDLARYHDAAAQRALESV